MPFSFRNYESSSSLVLFAVLAAVTPGELPAFSHWQGEETLPQSDEGRGRGGDVVRVRGDAAQMVRRREREREQTHRESLLSCSFSHSLNPNMRKRAACVLFDWDLVLVCQHHLIVTLILTRSSEEHVLKHLYWCQWYRCLCFARSVRLSVLREWVKYWFKKKKNSVRICSHKVQPQGVSVAPQMMKSFVLRSGLTWDDVTLSGQFIRHTCTIQLASPWIVYLIFGPVHRC